MDDLSEPLKRFRHYLETNRYAAHHTVRGYLGDLLQLEQHLAQHGMTLLTATPGLIDGHLADLAGRLSAVSRARHLSSIKQLYRFLVREELLETSPVKHARPPPTPLPELRPVPTVRKVLRVLAQPPGRTLLGLRDRAILEMLYGAGIRVGELAGMDLLSVDAAERSILVTGKGGRQRWCPVNAHAIRALEKYLARRARFTSARGTQHPTALFLSDRGTRLTTAQIRRRVKAAAAEAGLELTPHRLRHAYATHLMHAGAKVQDIQLLLGHSDVSTTQRYTQVTDDFIRREYLRHHPRVGEPSSTRSNASPPGGRDTPRARTRSSAATLWRRRGDPTHRANSASAYRVSSSVGVGTRRAKVSH